MIPVSPQIEVTDGALLLRLNGHDDIQITQVDLAIMLVNAFSALTEQAQIVESLPPSVRVMTEDLHERIGAFLGVNDGVRTDYASDAQGIMYAQHNEIEGTIEFTAIEIDVETQEPSGGLTFSVSGDVGLAWATQIMATISESGLGSFDALVTARNRLSNRIEGQLLGKRPNDKASSVAMTIMAWLNGGNQRSAEIEGASRGEMSFELLTPDEASSLDRFIASRPDLKITPAHMLKGGRELDNLRTASGITARKLVRGLGNGIKANRAMARMAIMQGTQPVDMLSLEELRIAAKKMFEGLLSGLGGKVLDQLGRLTGTTKLKLACGYRDEVNQLTDLVVQALSTKDEPDERLMAQVAFIVRNWVTTATMQTCGTHGYSMISVQGAFAGIGYQDNGSEPGPLFPVRAMVRPS